VRFWDSSAVVPLLLHEPTTAVIQTLYAADRQLLVCWTTTVEVWSAVARRRRDQALRSPDVRAARERLSLLRKDWAEVDDLESLRARSLRLVEVHPLRTADALQLAAALVATQDQPDGFPFVTLDERLAEAAETEGFRILPAAS
jgi:predicted nucleic acid-binding protein